MSRQSCQRHGWADRAVADSYDMNRRAFEIPCTCGGDGSCEVCETAGKFSRARSQNDQNAPSCWSELQEAVQRDSQLHPKPSKDLKVEIVEVLAKRGAERRLTASGILEELPEAYKGTEAKMLQTALDELVEAKRITLEDETGSSALHGGKLYFVKSGSN
jgi:hypothetical protein